MEYVTVGYRDFELQACSAGSGPPLMLVPGHTMSIARWVDTGYVDALMHDRQVIVVDPLGHGESSKTADIEAYRSERLVDHLVAVLDALDVERTDVWGYSRGAAMAALLAHQRPERVRSLVYGGNVLFDPVPILAALDMAPDMDKIEADHQRALAGDWAAFWENFPVPLTDELKADIESRNDLGSISASGLAGRYDSVAWTKPAAPTMAHWGSDEIFHQLNVDAAAELDITISVVPGGHGEAFVDSAGVLASVVPFLNGLSMD